MDDKAVSRGASRTKWAAGGAVWLMGCLLWLLTGPTVTVAEGNWTVPPAPPVLQNSRMECEDGFVPGVISGNRTVYIPRGWTVVYVHGAPQVLSTRLSQNDGVCDRSDAKFVERLSGYDSVYIRSEDIETLPNPGKSFDVVLYQRVPATIGGTYSLSAWMISRCRNRAEADPCPPGEYIAKLVGLDPLGGIDPNAASIIWVENRLNQVDEQGKPLGWQNLYVGTRALTETLTVFLRMTAPYDQRGNSGFMDEVSLIRGPYARLLPLPEEVTGNGPLALAWEGLQSQEIAALGGTYQLHYDVQVRPEGGEWRDLVVKTAQTSQVFVPRCLDTAYEFRVRAGTEQPPAPPEGVSPNHRYPGAWSLPIRVDFVAPAVAPTMHITPTGGERLVLPSMYNDVGC